MYEAPVNIIRINFYYNQINFTYLKISSFTILDPNVRFTNYWKGKKL